MILKRNKNDIKRLYSDMEKQFPISELKPMEEFQNLFSNNQYIAYDVVNKEQKIGYVIIVEDKNNKIIWIDYLAVLKEFHSHGYGSEILKELEKIYKNFDGCYLEVEKPDNNIPNTLRRINFYKKHGAVKLPVEYYYPNSNGILPMDLYYIPYTKRQAENILIVIKNIFNILHKNIKDIDEKYAKIRLIYE